MGKIVYLMGKSSSGKDTIYKRLLEQNDIRLEKIVPYTTRPIRAEEQEGVEYHFTDEGGYQELLQKGEGEPPQPELLAARRIYRLRSFRFKLYKQRTVYEHLRLGRIF